ncbi:glycosyltransferase family 2 protein [Photobacterium phosphoreum]|uniref:glycosyltransferase family 2 protein n=1 Tax=Photobacterium phosphoreum TaxID=659 RepID=UPI0039AF471E
MANEKPFPFVSIITPSFNCIATIEKTVHSVISQTMDNWELLIVDDCSTDSSYDLITNISNVDDRIKTFKNTVNLGASKSRNKLIELSVGNYIAFLDTDDIWHPRKLELQIKAMNNNNCLASHSCYYRVDENGNKISLVTPRERVSYKDMLTHNHIGNLTGIYNAKVLGKFYQKNIGHEDYEMWLRILSKTDSIAVLEPLASYTVSTNSLSANKLKAAKWHYNILRNEIGLNTLKSSFYFSHYVYNAIKTRTSKVS